ncbi:MAG: hypothetical protein IH586_16050, partial [Anaerolineaceae bacterium]|nr:hypothetical protein [Anaerolineaceae bacterium]
TSTDEKQELTDLREHLLQLTKEIDQRMQEQAKQSRALLEEILKADDIEQAAAEAMQEMDDMFGEALREELQKARQSGDMERGARLQKVVNVIQQASAPPPEVALAEELMGAETEADRFTILNANAEKITPEFLQVLTSLMGQLEQSGQQDLNQRLQEVYRSALRFSMQANLKK